MNVGDRYGRLDRLLHDIAFRAGTAQQAMSDVEEILFRGELEGIPLEDPVFVTALPRSGTTILLKLLAGSGRFATHTYRDMPFVLCPMLWNRFSRRFTVDDRPVERAHGDGLQVSADSPEAFEEMIWKHFWPSHYRDDRIVPWGRSERNREFEAFLRTHMRKLIALRRQGPDDGRRYLSKNNLNIARIASPPAPLDRGTWLVPFREPVQQAASMLRQHRRFLEIHDEDDFIRRYMEAIGHHEFGRGLKPVNFDGWLDEVAWKGDAEADPTGLDFWLRYWVAAYDYVLEHLDLQSDDAPAARLVSYRHLTSEPEQALARLAGAVGIPTGELTPLADWLQPPRTHEGDEASLPDDLMEKARTLHERMKEQSRV